MRKIGDFSQFTFNIGNRVEDANFFRIKFGKNLGQILGDCLSVFLFFYLILKFFQI